MIYRRIRIWDERYLISNTGEIFDIILNATKSIHYSWKNKLVSLYWQQYLISKLVAEYFIDNPNGYEYVWFLDWNHHNTNYLNLFWCASPFRWRIIRDERTLSSEWFNERDLKYIKAWQSTERSFDYYFDNIPNSRFNEAKAEIKHNKK